MPGLPDEKIIFENDSIKVLHMFRFGHPELLYLLFIIPLFIVVFIIYSHSVRKSVRNLGDKELLTGLMPDRSNGRRIIKFILFCIALISIIVGMARPQFGTKLEDVESRGIEIIIALDVSRSMLARDIEPSRLERAKQAISSLLHKLHGDKIGLIAFAGDAYTQVPITSDYISARMFLSELNPDFVSRQGTAIGKAIDLASVSFSPDNNAGKAIVVISDGENHEGDAVEAAKRAYEKGIRVFTIGIGKTKGSLIPEDPHSPGKGFVKDNEGSTVMSRMNPQMLNEIAVAGGGSFFPASRSRVGLKDLYEELNKLEKAKLETKTYTEYNEQFQYFIGFGLFLILLEFVILEKKNKWLKNIKLFESK
jgi:Ca-activated chloride channel homolog